MRPFHSVILYRRGRGYATVTAAPLRAYPPPPPPDLPKPALAASAALDSHLLSHLSTVSSPIDVPSLVREYSDRAGHVLDVSLPYESRLSAERRVDVSAAPALGVVLIAHCVLDEARQEHAVTLSSGFALAAPSGRAGESLILSCAHTLEEIRRSRLLAAPGRALRSGSFVLAPSESARASVHPITSVQASLPRADLVLFSAPVPALRSLPVSPYPAHADTHVLTHLVHDAPLPGAAAPSVPLAPGIHARWTESTIAGYRDHAGREAQPGTYDALAHLLFTPLPTPGSSGGPIVDEESGAVVGVMLGSRTDFGSRERGFGVPSEAIFEMFSLPGLEERK